MCNCQHRMVSAFDAVASAFDRHRPLPAGVPEAIRSAVLSLAAKAEQAQILDVGAGTGRIGKAFVAAGDRYVGVDHSAEMLDKFLAQYPAARLVQANAEQLPFPGGTFDVVMLMQVLSGARDWRAIVSESRRVLQVEGAIVVGRAVMPVAGINAQLKTQLRRILEELNVEAHDSKQAREDALAFLERSAISHERRRAAWWMVNTTPREVLERRRTGARFAALPSAIREEAVRKLTNCAEAMFGSLDRSFAEQYNFELDIFRF